MQNRYVADIGDFGKYGLLRYLIHSNIKIGIHWCIYPDENHNFDGKHIKYLSNSSTFRKYDSELFDSLNDIISTWNSKNCSPTCRTIKHIENSKILKNTVFYNFTSTDVNTSYFKNCDIIFFDPDNGFEIKSVKKTYKKAPKYVFYDDLAQYLSNGHSLIVYQHLDHSKDCYSRKLKEINENFNNHFSFYLSFNYISHRAYFFILNKHHKNIVNIIENGFLKTNWHELFAKSF